MKAVTIAVIVTVTLSLHPTSASAQQEQTRPMQPDRAALFTKFEAMLSGATLIGHFTILGKKESPLRREEYTIKSVRKLPQGDFWLFQARIQYGDKDMTLPLPLNVKWAGDTPVITLTDLTIPGLGTCGARVVIHNDKYAGTWTHGNASGHMFGVIKKIEETSDGDNSSEVNLED